MKNYSTPSLLIQTIHTVVKGRARYKVNGLYRSETLKKYLEDKLSQNRGIAEVRANHWTGNILVIFDKEISLEVVSTILKDTVLNYKQHSNQFLKKRENYSTELENNLVIMNGTKETNSKTQLGSVLLMKMLLNKQFNQASNQLIFVWGTVGSLAVATGVLHYYGLDSSILILLQRLHTPLLNRIMVGITFLGEPVTLLLICLGLIMSPLGSNRSEKATTLAIATVGAVGLNYWLKMRFGRIRPALWERIINVRHYSFPSGHAMMSLVTYGLISYLLVKQFPQWRGQILALSFILIILIGFSRLYLGVHWPTDVLAGYAVGLVWLSACILCLELWQAYSQQRDEKRLTLKTSSKAIFSESGTSEYISMPAS